MADVPRRPFDYAVVRVVPRIEREEFVNVGVIVFARTLEFLDLAVDVDEVRIRTLDPRADLDAISRHLAGMRAVSAGDASAGAIARLPRPDRFHWLVAPRSTMLQTSAVHAGMTSDPAATLRELLARLVAL